jgi:hypothetical protein
MRKSILLLTIVTLVAGLYLAGVAVAAHKIQNTGKGTITLDRNPNASDVPENASGTARFRVTTKADGFYKMRVRVRVTGLPEQAGKVYEVWLRDKDNDYNLSLGTFQTNGGQTGKGGLTITRTITKLSPFDEIVISRETKNDDNPTINTGTNDDNIVLKGELAH